MREPHPFSAFVRILGRGKTLSRSLTEAEAEQAMGMILDGEALPEQIGAFLMLLRMKEESPDELAGFTRAARSRMVFPDGSRADLDWSSYAGKKRQLPWFLLAALALAKAGYRVFMHGGEGHTPGRLYTSEALRALGLAPAADVADAARRIERDNFAYLTLDRLSPRLDALLGLKPILGLRSPINTFVRMLNPLRAPASIQSVFHPGYLALHREAERLLGQPGLVVFRGEGGEVERRPNKPCETLALVDGVSTEARWPARIDPRVEPDAIMDLTRLGALWRGEIEDSYGEAAVAGTIALALHAMGKAATVEEAEAGADALWRLRDRQAFPCHPRESGDPACDAGLAEQGSILEAAEPYDAGSPFSRGRQFSAAATNSQTVAEVGDLGRRRSETAAIGEVYLVGAGPGDPELLTLRAARLISQADVALYDRLARSPVMDLIPARAERIYVGKTPGAHPLAQDQISALMIRLAREGKRVLRLKGGDPFLFGRGGEEAEALAQAGVPFEVCPGITAASGAAASALIPLTHRDHSQACIFVTGQGKEGPSGLDWPALVRTNQTVAIYMGLANLDALMSEFIARGAPPDTPAAIVDNATRPNQKVIVATIAALAEAAEAAALKGPAVVFVGSVATLRAKLLGRA